MDDFTNTSSPVTDIETEVLNDIAKDTSDKEIYKEAVWAKELCVKFYGPSRQFAISDSRVFYGDCENTYQWDPSIYSARKQQGKPSLTINRARQHCLDIINQIKQTPIKIALRPTGSEGSMEAAEVFEGLIKFIENKSNAKHVYENALFSQVICGFGFWRIWYDFSTVEEFNMELKLLPISNPFSVYFDPKSTNPTGEDADFVIILDKISKKQAYADYTLTVTKPGWSKYFGNRPISEVNTDASAAQTPFERNSDDSVDIVEYFRKVKVIDTLLEVKIPKNSEDLSDYEIKLLVEGELSDTEYTEYKPFITRTRKIEYHKVELYKFVGNTIHERVDWPGKYIPIIKVSGEEMRLDGKYDLKGHIRYLRDPQFIYNWNTSKLTEISAKVFSSSFFLSEETFEKYGEQYAKDNQTTNSALPYVATAGGQNLPPPIPVPAIQLSEPFLQGMAQSKEELYLTSGQGPATLSENTNDRTGLAIKSRQRASTTATYHFIDNYCKSIEYTGKILLDLIPKIYSDQDRVIMILDKDKNSIPVHIDPTLQTDYTAITEETKGIIKKVINPIIARYEITPDSALDYGTKAEEANDILLSLLQYNPNISPYVMDIIVKNLNIKGNMDIAARLKRAIPKNILGIGPSQEEQELQQQLETVKQTLVDSQQSQALLQRDLTDKTKKEQIEAYDKETKRVVEFLKLINEVDQEIAPKLAQQLVAVVLQSIHLAQENPVMEVTPSDILQEQINIVEKKFFLEELLQHGAEKANSQNPEKPTVARPVDGKVAADSAGNQIEVR